MRVWTLESAWEPQWCQHIGMGRMGQDFPNMHIAELSLEAACGDSTYRQGGNWFVLEETVMCVWDLDEFVLLSV